MTEKWAVELINLTKKYGDFKAVNNISFKVKKGEVFGFLGPNGAGKTSTIKIMTGLSRPTTGRCRLLDKEINNSKKLYQKIGVVFEEKNLYDRLTGMENLLFYGKIYAVTKKRIKKILQDFDLTEAADKQVKKYSKGMKQRLLICRALLHQPELLILDEPTSGLDPVSVEIIREAIKGFSKEGKTIFMSTHYLEEAERLCDRVAIINKGEILALDRPQILQSKYGQPYLEVRFSNILSHDIISPYLKEGDKIIADKTVTVLLFALENKDVGTRLDLLRKKYQILAIHTREAQLTEVFKKLTTTF